MKPAQDAVFIEIGDLLQRLFDPHIELYRADVAVAIVLETEQGADELAEKHHHIRVPIQRVLHIGFGKRDARLTQILATGAEVHNLTPGQPGAENQSVEPVILHLAVPDALEQVVELVAHVMHVKLGFRGPGNDEVMYPDLRRALIQ